MAVSASRRATSLGEFESLMSRVITPAGVEAGLRFRPRPDDVIISPFAKCGTTWLQQIVHSLRTRGDVAFDDISRVVPWIETAADLGLELDAPQRARPRAYKSHLSWHAVPKGARYLVAVRDPRDALLSMYRFMEGWFLEPGRIPLGAFARGGFLNRANGRDYWTHLASWWPRRHDGDVLLLAYEHMKEDLHAAVCRVASFLGLAGDAAAIDAAMREASLEAMQAHRDRYDDRMMRERSEAVCGLPPGSDSAKVRAGRVGEHAGVLGAELLAELDARWAESMGQQFDLPDYPALLEVLRREQG